jgi:hypothetical protein
VPVFELATLKPRTLMLRTSHFPDLPAATLHRVLAEQSDAVQVVWTKLIGFAGHPQPVWCEIDTFGYRVLPGAARTTRGAREIRIRIDATGRWAAAIITAWQKIRAPNRG